MKKDEEKEAVALIKTLSNPHRLAIMSLLGKSKKDMCVNEIARYIGISQSLTSHQLAYLEARDVVKGHRMGQTTCYKPAKNSRTKKLLDIIRQLLP